MFVITIDGTAGSGKSTIANELAKVLKIKRLNTGEIYRSITCEYVKQYGEKIPTKSTVESFVKDLKVEISFNLYTQNVYVNGTNYTKNLREERINIFTPILSSFDVLRECVRGLQRDFASKNDCIVEGRDIGRVVFPHAKCKFFFTASVVSRAQRRLKQMNDEHGNLPKIIKEIKSRDDIDSTREFGAMKPAQGAIIVDNSNMTVEQTLNFCLEKIKEISLI